MTANSTCVRSVDTAHADESLWLAAERMHQRSVGALVIVNERNEPIGILTDRDIVERAVVTRLDADRTLVGTVMTERPLVIYESASTESALAMMENGPCRRLPVVDHEGKLTGIVSLDDLLMQSARELTMIGRILKRETPCGVAHEMVAPMAAQVGSH